EPSPFRLWWDRARMSHHHASPVSESPLVKTLLIGFALLWLIGFLGLPLVIIFVEALAQGIAPYLSALADPDALAAMRLTLLVSVIAVPANLVFGLVASWALAKFDFPARNALITFIDLPFSVSPVISGLVFVLLFGAQGLLGSFFVSQNIQIIFAVPGIVLA